MAKDKTKQLDLLNLRRAAVHAKKLWPFLRPQWPQLLLVILGTGMYSAGYAARLVVIKPFLELVNNSDEITNATARQIVEQVAPWAGVLFVGAICMGIGTWLKQYFSGYIKSYTVIQLQRAIVDRVLKQPMAFFNSEKKGALISRLTANSRGAAGLTGIIIESVISHPFTIIAVLGVLLYTSPILSLFTFVIFPIVLFPVMMFAGKIRKATKKQYKKVEVTGNFFHQMLDGIRVVKSYRLEDAQRQEYEKASEDVFRRARKVARYKGASRFGIEFTYNSVMAVALVGIGFLITTTWFNEVGGLPMFVQFFAGLVFLYDPARKMGHSLNEIQESTAKLDRAYELLDREPEIQDQPDAKEAPRRFETIRFEHVDFEYLKDRPVLRDITFEVKSGTMTAFIGQSGMGKSTLMDLIPRFYDPTRGAIKIDGVDLRDIRTESWLENIAIVSQETFLFNTTIRHNIMCGKPEATEEEVIEAARAAHIWHDIEKMPEGLDTKLGDRGVTVSGGQRQRIAIARAFLRKAPVLLLDEATSSLDTESEREVQGALDRLIEGCTVFAVAHRLSTIRDADEIMVLNEGRIIESGSHDELLKLNRAYANAYRLQIGEDADAEAA